MQARPLWGGSELAERCGVTERTLRRDVVRLRQLGYSVEAISGRYGGYRLESGGALPPLLLDDEEAVTVAMALRMSADGGLPGLEDASIAALAKIEHVLPARIQTRIAEVAAATVRWSQPSSAVPLRVGVLVTLARACQGTERLRFSYRDAQDNQTDRHVEPLQLVHLSRRWYLVAFDKDREDWRTFRVDRLSDPEATGMRFTPTDPPDPLTFVAAGIAVGSYRYRARMLLAVPVEEAAKLVPATIGVISAHGSRSELSIGADDLDWIARFLARLPCDFEVIEPEELRDSIIHLADRLTRLARR